MEINAMHVVEGKERQLALLSNEAAQNWAMYRGAEDRCTALNARVEELTKQRDEALAKLPAPPTPEPAKAVA